MAKTMAPASVAFKTLRTSSDVCVCLSVEMVSVLELERRCGGRKLRDKEARDLGKRGGWELRTKDCVESVNFCRELLRKVGLTCGR